MARSKAKSRSSASMQPAPADSSALPSPAQRSYGLSLHSLQGYVERFEHAKRGIFGGSKTGKGNWRVSWIVLDVSTHTLIVYDEKSSKKSRDARSLGPSPEVALEKPKPKAGHRRHEEIALSDIVSVATTTSADNDAAANSSFSLEMNSGANTMRFRAKSPLACEQWVRGIQVALDALDTPLPPFDVAVDVTTVPVSAHPVRKTSIFRRLGRTQHPVVDTEDSSNSGAKPNAELGDVQAAKSTEDPLSLALGAVEAKLKKFRDPSTTTNNSSKSRDPKRSTKRNSRGGGGGGGAAAGSKSIDPHKQSRTGGRTATTGGGTKERAPTAQIYDSQVFMTHARSFAAQASLPRSSPSSRDDDDDALTVDVPTRKYKSDSFQPINLMDSIQPYTRMSMDDATADGDDDTTLREMNLLVLPEERDVGTNGSYDDELTGASSKQVMRVLGGSAKRLAARGGKGTAERGRNGKGRTDVGGGGEGRPGSASSADTRGGGGGGLGGTAERRRNGGGPSGTAERRRNRRRNSESSVVPMGRRGPRSAVVPILANNGLTGPLQLNPKPEATVAFLRNVILSSSEAGGTVLFENLDDQSISEIIDRMHRVDVTSGQTIVKHGQTEDTFYVVESGVLNLYSNHYKNKNNNYNTRNRNKNKKKKASELEKKLMAVKQAGSHFGEIALLYEKRGNVSVEAVSDGVLWSLSRVAFHDILTTAAARQQLEKLRFLVGVPLIMDNLSVQNIIALSDAMEFQRYKDGDVVLDAGTALTKMYIVKNGQAHINVPKKKKVKSKGGKSKASSTSANDASVHIDVLNVGEFFGEWALLDHNAVSDVALVASGDTTMLSLDVQEFVELIGPLRDFVKKRWEDVYDMTNKKVDPIIELPDEDAEENDGGSQVYQSHRHTQSTNGTAGRHTRPSTHASTARDSMNDVNSDTDDDSASNNVEAQESAFFKNLQVFSDDGTLDRLREAKTRSTGGSSVSSLGSDVPPLAPMGPVKPPKDSDSAVLQGILDAKKRFSQKLVGGSFSAPPGVGVLEMQRQLSARQLEEDTNKKVSTKGTLADTFAHLESQAGANGAGGSLDKPWTKCEPINPDLKFNDLMPVRVLGKGHFGKVYLVLSRNASEPTAEAKKRLGRWAEPTREAFALKCLSRHYITSNGWETLVENERAAMLELTKFCDSPFLLKMYNTYSDSRNLYLLLELCSGGDLYAALKSQRKQRFADHSSVKFYTACAITGLAAMHARNIIYRDLKPENMLLGADGYVKIGDFGLAKKSIKTFTVAGTPDYMAPETILSRGHDTAVDYWALGILIYELIFGVTPFYGEEPMDIYERILAHENEDDLTFPDEELIGEHGASICKKLLHPKRTRRLGNILSGVSGVMFHPFFKEFDWNSLQNKRMEPPFVPGEMDLREYNNIGEDGEGNSFVPDFDSNEEDFTGWDPGY